MPGIKSYGVYIPRYRLSRSIIFAAMGFLGAPPMGGEKAVANGKWCTRIARRSIERRR